MKYDPISRRFFLQGLGGLILSVPVLPSLLPRAHAQQALAASRRFIGVANPFGVYPEWFPTLAANAQIAAGVYSANLSSVSGDLSPVFTNQAFSDLKSKILFLRGLDQCHFTGHNDNALFGAGHNANGFSEGGLTSPTIDTVMAQSSIIYPTVPRVRNLILCPHPEGYSDGSMSATKTSSGLVEMEGIAVAKAAFDVALGSAPPTTTPTAPSPATTIGSADKRKVVDKVYEDYRRVRSGRAISTADKGRLEDHMTYLSEIQGKLPSDTTPAPTPTVSCTRPSIAQTSIDSKADFDKAIQSHIDILVAALACGNTRVASLFLAHDYHRVMFGNSDYHGNVSHSTTNVKGFLDVHGNIAKHVAYLIRKLDAITDVDGKSLLHNSIVLWGNELGAGNHHTSYNLPIFIAGNGGGEILPGRIVDYRQRPFVAPSSAKSQQIGRPYNQLLVSIMQIMGLQPKDYEQNGKAGFGTYDEEVVKEVGALHAPFKTVEVKRAVLPGLKG